MYEAVPLTQYWHDKDIPKDVAECITSFARHNPSLHQRIFDAVTAREYINDRFSAREVRAFEACAVPAMQADYFRLCVMIADGGWYSDADSVCTGNLRSLIRPDSDVLLFTRHDWGPVINGLMWSAAPGHEFFCAWLEQVTENIERQMSNDVWTVAGAATSTFLYFAATGNEEILKAWSDSIVPDVHNRLQVLRECRAKIDSGRFPNIIKRLDVRELSAAHPSWADGQCNYKKTSVHWTRWTGSIFKNA